MSGESDLPSYQELLKLYKPEGKIWISNDDSAQVNVVTSGGSETTTDTTVTGDLPETATDSLVIGAVTSLTNEFDDTPISVEDRVPIATFNRETIETTPPIININGIYFFVIFCIWFQQISGHIRTTL